MKNHLITGELGLTAPKSRDNLVPCSPDALQPDPLIHRYPLALSVSCLLSSVFCPTRPSCPACLPSTLVETPLQISPFSAKQSQFQNGQYKHKYSTDKDLCQQTTNNEQRTLFKTNPIKAKRTQFQNRQNEDKHRDNKGLCKSTTSNEQRTPFKTNPIEPNCPAPPGRNTRYEAKPPLPNVYPDFAFNSARKE